jgi:hypothetical protein
LVKVAESGVDWPRKSAKARVIGTPDILRILRLFAAESATLKFLIADDSQPGEPWPDLFRP